VRTDAGTIASPGSPGYTDNGVPYGQLTYRVRATDIHGNVGAWSNDLVIPTALAVDGEPLPRALELRPNAPNPFAGPTAIRFGLPASAAVRLEVYDVRGARAASRELGTLAAGWRTVTFDGNDDSGHRLPCGVYSYRVVTAGDGSKGRMVIAR
jgi:hypothetical protein